MIGFFFILCWVCATFAQPNTTLLSPGLPYQDSVLASQTDYYYISVSGQTQTLTVTLTPLGDGDPDLFLSLQDDHPSATSEYTARSYGSDAITIPASDYSSKSYAYIAVFGWRNANYTLSASFESVIQLIEGIPQSGQVPKEGIDYYEVSLSDVPSHTELTITATPTQGDIMVYISATTHPEPQNRSSWQWSSSIHYQGEAIVIRSTDPGWSQNGTYFIAIYGTTNAIYSLVAAGNFTNIQLRSGIPQNDHCETGQVEYFQIGVLNAGCNLTITVTPISGDPDLYVSNITRTPNQNNKTWASLAFGADTIVIRDASIGTYYIGVSGWRNTTFTVLADLTCSNSTKDNATYHFITLVNGSPQQGVLNRGEEQYYKFHQEGTENITIAVTRRYGDPDLYICKDVDLPSPQHYDWKSIAFGEDTLTIFSTDPKFCTNCDYYIGVFAASNCSYTISAKTSDHVVRLQEGVPMVDTLAQSQYRYFRFDVETAQELTITVTPLGHGDPDLYISRNSSQPSATNFQWAAQRLYGDSITIPHTDPNACQFCTYWIGVFGFSNTTFSIVANFNHTILLQDGVPQSGNVPRGAISYYDFQSQGNSDVMITLTTLNGSASLYVSSGDNLPETNSYQWYQPYYNQIKSVVIPLTDDHACRNSSCYYHAGVYSLEDSDYTIVASTVSVSTSTTLMNGVAQRGSVVPGGWKYFTMRLEEAGQDLSIVLTPISGDPDIYVLRNYSQPNATYYEKKSVRYGSDSIDYDNAPLGTYYIGVTAGGNSTFNILGLITQTGTSCSSASCVIPLFNGQPQEGTVHVSRWNYYSFDVVTPKTSVTFTLTKQYGDPDLYINFNSTFPNTSNHQWASTNTQSDSIVISSPSIGHYIIGIYAYQTSAYTLTVSAIAPNTSSSNETILITLQNGVPIRGQATAQQYLYYVLPVDSSDRDVTITVTPFSGDPDLYVSTTNSHPSQSNNTWHASAYLGDSLTIATTSPDFCHCPYYIAVYAYTAASYTLVASFTDTLDLQNGQPQTGTVALHAFDYYRFRLDSPSDLTVILTPQSGNPDLYVSLGSKPTLTNSTWKVIDFFTTSQLVIRASDQNCSSNCNFYIGIYGSSVSNFTLIATTDTVTSQLMNGVPAHDHLDAHNWEYYSFDVNTPGQDVTFLLTALSGDPDLYVSHKSPRPNLTDYEYFSRQQSGDAVGITSSNVTTWYLGVYGYTNCIFTVTAYIHCGGERCPSLVLINGVPQTGVLNQNEYQYYNFFLANHSDELTISVTRTVGDPDIFVCNNGSTPTKSLYQWSSSAFGQDLITIRNPTPATYKIAVYAASTSQYSLQVSTERAPTTLASGIPVVDDLVQGQFEYFKLDVDRLDEDLTVTVTSFNGDPDLYISDTTQFPNISTATWSARSPREDSITIPASRLKIGSYYISVQAWTNCTFTIIASFANEILLQDGTPQAGSVAWEQSRYYKFVVGSNHSDLTFTLTPYTGNAWLYISNFTSPVYGDARTYNRSSTDPTTGQVITIFRQDSDFCTGCTYTVMVYGHQASNYSLVVGTSITVITLQEGVAQRAWVSTGEYEYFLFNMHIPIGDLRITVTPLSGDPDLYVSTTSERPNATNYNWRGVNYGADAVNIDYTDPNYRVGTFYIAVFAWRNSTFTILATAEDLNQTNICSDPDRCPPNLLQNGLPQVGLLNASGDHSYYEFYVGNVSQDVTFTVTPRYGDPDIYIRNDGARPNSTYSQWSSRSYGRDSITIPQAQGRFPARYIISVEAYSHTMYSIVATTSDVITLLENGVPIQVHLEEHVYGYYYVMVSGTDSSDPLVISATAISGDPDLYISNTSTHPNASDKVWSSMSYGSDQFVLQNPAPGSYYIGAYAFHSTTFTLVATNGPIALVNGEPHADQISRGIDRMFQIIVNDPTQSELLITLNVNQGDPILYVGNLPNGTRPDPAKPWTYRWSTADPSQTASRYMISIPGGSFGTCYNCTYFIRVVVSDTSSTASYSLTASYGSFRSVLLSSGKPFSATVSRGQYIYFRSIVDSLDRDLNIGVTTFTGDTDVFVSTNNSSPTSGNAQWGSIHDPSARGDYISILHTTPGFVAGVYYIGIYGYEDSQFTITLTTKATLLPPGTSQVGSLSTNDTNPSAFFFFDVTERTDVSLSISAFENYNVSHEYHVYISTNSSNTEPRENENTWHATLVEGGDSLFIPRDDIHACDNCTYYVGVFGSTPSQKFTISASTEYTPDLLFNGKQLQGSLSPGALKYYQIYVPNSNGFYVSVETCSGNANIYMAKDTYKPSKEHYSWSSESSTDNDYLTVKEEVLNSEFYIGVFGESSIRSDYIITSWTTKPTATSPNNGHGEILAKAGFDTVELLFNPATSSEATLSYTIYWSHVDSGTVMYSFCGLINANLAATFERKTTADSISFTVEGLETDVSYAFNVMVSDSKGQKTLYVPVTAITGGEPGGIPLSLIIGIGLPVAAAILAFVIYLVVRNRKLTKELEIEMHDVPKSAVRKAVGGPRNQPYDELLQEDDDEPSQVIYDPPDPSRSVV